MRRGYKKFMTFSNCNEKKEFSTFEEVMGKSFRGITKTLTVLIVSATFSSLTVSAGNPIMENNGLPTLSLVELSK